MYIHKETKRYPVTQGEIMGLHQDTMFPTPFIPPEGYYFVNPTFPEYDKNTHKAVEAEPIEADGVWTQVWDVVEMTDEEVQGLHPFFSTCTRRQGLLALLSYGFKRSDVERKITEIEDEILQETAWIEYLSDTWDINNPFLVQMWVMLGGDGKQLPDIFRLANTL